MGPHMGPVRREEGQADRGTSLGAPSGIDLTRESFDRKHEADVDRTETTRHQQAEGPRFMNNVRAGFAAINVIRGLNVAVTGALSIMNFSIGRPGMGALWGGLSVLWMVLALAGKSQGSETNSKEGEG